MREIVKAACRAAVLVLPIAAAAQGTNAFDGTYRGILLTSQKGGASDGACPPPSNSTPPTLTIANGNARTGNLEGTITPQGVLKMTSSTAFVVEGLVDAQGNVRAQGSGRGCAWTYQWQRAR